MEVGGKARGDMPAFRTSLPTHKRQREQSCFLVAFTGCCLRATTFHYSPLVGPHSSHPLASTDASTTSIAFAR